MPGPHFNSKRLKAAKNVRAEFAPGSVPRVGTRLFTLRLLPRTVEKNCNCRIPLPPPAPAATVITVNMGLYTPTAMSLNKMRDNNDYNGTGGTIGFITAYNVAVGDTISFTDSGGVAYTGTVTAVDATKSGGRNNEITLSPDPTNMGNVTNVTITQS